MLGYLVVMVTMHVSFLKKSCGLKCKTKEECAKLNLLNIKNPSFAKFPLLVTTKKGKTLINVCHRQDCGNGTWKHQEHS
jgi:hypothetical protein